MARDKGAWLSRKAPSRIHTAIQACLLHPCLLIAVALVGWILYRIPPNPNQKASFDQNRPVELQGVLVSARLVRGEQFHYRLQVTSAFQDAVPLSLGRFVDLYVPTTGAGAAMCNSGAIHAGCTVRVFTGLRQPTVRRTPGAANPRLRRWIEHRPFYASLKSCLQLELLTPELSPWRRLPERTAAYLITRLPTEGAKALQGEVRSFVEAAVLGESARLDDEIWSGFADLGVVHLLVVSGFHVLVVRGILWLALRPLRCGRTFLGTVGVWFYVMMTGARSPALRAAVLLTTGEVGHAFGLQRRPWNLLGLAAVVILLGDPRQLYSTGFQMTFLSVAAILAVAPWLETRRFGLAGLSDLGMRRLLTEPSSAGRLRRRTRFRLEYLTEFLPATPGPGRLRTAAHIAGYVLALLTVSLAIQILLTPLLLNVGNRFSLGAPLANLVIVPLFTVWFPVALFYLFTVLTPAAAILAFPVNWGGGLLLSLLEFLEGILPTLYLPAPDPLVMVLSYSLLLAGYYLACNRPLRFLLIGVALAPLVLPHPKPATGKLVLTWLDVGQGEALHIAYPDGNHGMFDCGGSSQEAASRYLAQAVVVRYLLHQRIRRLDFLLASHPESDHIGTLPFLTRCITLDRFYAHELSGTSVSSGISLPYSRLKAEDNFWKSGVEHVVVHPPDQAPWSNPNDRSLVILLRFKKFQVLTTGDISSRVETHLNTRLPTIDVLKVPHHGSRTGTSSSFLATTQPTVAVVSCGTDNPFGHPAPEVLERLTNSGVRVFVTGRDGAVRVETDGHRFQVSTFEGRSFRLSGIWECGRSSIGVQAD